MKKRLAVLLASAALFSGIGAVAGAQSPPPAATMLRMPGTIDKYEASTRVLSLSTSNGKVQFPLATATRVLVEGRRVDVSELAKLSGYRAAVRYSESGGNKTVESVHVFRRDDANWRANS
jgi:hypothetical protein